MSSAAGVVAPLEDRFLRLPEVLDKVGLSRKQIWKLQRLNQFPKPYKLTARAIGFRLSEINRWMAERPAA